MFLSLLSAKTARIPRFVALTICCLSRRPLSSVTTRIFTLSLGLIHSSLIRRGWSDFRGSFRVKWTKAVFLGSKVAPLHFSHFQLYGQYFLGVVLCWLQLNLLQPKPYNYQQMQGTLPLHLLVAGEGWH